MYIKKILLILVILSLIVGSIFSYNVYQHIFSPNTSFENSSQEIFIKTGTTYNELLTQIKPYLKNEKSFNWLAQKKGYSRNIKPGKYILPKGANSNKLIGILRSKNTPIKVSFNNQERLENLAGRIAQQVEIDSLSLLNSFKDPSFLKKHGFTLKTALSMYIPNSYQVFWNTTPETFRKKMLTEYNRFWNNERKAKAKTINLNPIEVYTLASIVHKETVKIDERPKVAGVYMNRLIKGIKLDADPTVIFSLKKHANNWNLIIKRVLLKDLKLDNPYNTYMNKGLPPGPIAMPDISAIDAVLNYEKHNYYYFVADVRHYGYHLFASTLSQHNRNSSKYHTWANKKGIKR